MKGVSRSIIVSLIFLIVIMFFLILVFLIFKEKSMEGTEFIKSIFSKVLKVI